MNTLVKSQERYYGSENVWIDIDKVAYKESIGSSVAWCLETPDVEFIRTCFFFGCTIRGPRHVSCGV